MGLITFSFFLDAIIFGLTVIYAVYKYFTWDFDYWGKRNVKALPPTPMVGNFLDVVAMKESIGSYLAKAYRKMPGLDYFGIWVFGTPHLIVRSPELIKHILVKDFNYFYDRTITSDQDLDPLMSHVLFVMKNPVWKAVRAKLTLIFTKSKIKNMVPLINAEGEAMREFIMKNGINNGIDLKELIAKFTTNVVTSCAFGVNALSFQDENAAFRSIGRRMFTFNFKQAVRGISCIFAPSVAKIFKVRFFEKGVNEFCRDAFWQAIEERKRTGVKRNDLIDIIIEMIKTDQLEGDEAVAQAVQFFAAGFETTASTISYTLYELALNDSLQTKLRAEIREACDGIQEVDYENIKNIKYLDQVIKETLRKYPVLPFLDRRCNADYTLPNGELTVEKGTPVYIPIYGLHYDEQYFPNPDVYDPERFSDANAGKINPYAYIPFGTGPRNCIGERFGLITSKLGIAYLLSNFYVECNERTPQPMVFEPKSLVLQPLGGLPMNVIPINQKMSVAS